MSKPRLRQTPSAMIEPSAVERSPSQFGPSIPTCLEREVDEARVGREQVPPDDRDRDDARDDRQVVADAEDGDAAGRSPGSGRRASSSPTAIVSGTPKSTKTPVFLAALMELLVVEQLRVVVDADELGAEPVLQVARSRSS